MDNLNDKPLKVIDILQQAQAQGTTRLTFELLPPLKGENIDAIFRAIETMREFNPAYVNITHHRQQVKLVGRPDGRVERRIVRLRPGTVGISAAIMARYGIPAVPHLICGDSSRFELEDMLIEMRFLGIDNVLALRGDPLPEHRSFLPHVQGYSHASELVHHISGMNRGFYQHAGIENCEPTDFCVGVAGYPETHAQAIDRAADIRNLRRKVMAGAQYVVTQLFFDNARYFAFVEECRAAGINVPIVPGLKPMSSYRQLELLPRVFHVGIPPELARQVQGCHDDGQVRAVGERWAVAQARELKQAGVPAIHFYTMGRCESLARIARQVF